MLPLSGPSSGKHDFSILEVGYLHVLAAHLAELISELLHPVVLHQQGGAVAAEGGVDPRPNVDIVLLLGAPRHHHQVPVAVHPRVLVAFQVHPVLLSAAPLPDARGPPCDQWTASRKNLKFRQLIMEKTGNVTLGMPGPWAEDDHEAADHYTTKVGGVPDWPTLDINPDFLKCSSCGGMLYFVAQIYAPISSSNVEVEERTLYVLGCPVPKCENQSDGWRVLRVQKCRSGHQSNDSCQEEKLSAERSTSTSIVNNWWETDVWIQGSRKQSEGGDDDVDLQALSQAISEAASQASCAKKQNESIMCSAVATKDCGIKSKVKDSSIAVLPCFYIYDEEERSLRSTIENQCFSLSIKDDPNLPADSEKWEAESYVYDKALGADRTYLKFKKRMDAYPEQCMRYSLGGKPLLATNDVRVPSNCGLCGAQRHFEMQLMPPLLYYLQQVANGQSTYSPQDWSWLTLIIYTCSKNCFDGSVEGKFGDSCWTVAEEYISIQRE